ncbi:transcription factor BIM2 isoform X6 [Elaeis guineensis]|uniref:Transcription factor BIM1 isoform X8 n=1 Tax=Elaeis guineensis var. tenera TaxID=51953 RepID=A0A6J0PLF5_ELAGV|nr:transcription factor BIM1 isoform X8 [Elaeis guineensis]
MELQGKKATYDFLSLYNKDSSFPHPDPRPPSQGFFLTTHDFLKPLERADKGHRHEAASGDAAVGRVGSAASVEHVLPGGIGTYSVSHVSDPVPLAMVKPERGTCRGVDVERKPEAYYDNGVSYGSPFPAAVPVTLWDESAAKDPWSRELTVKVDGKNRGDNDQKPGTPRSKHSATEQRRRSKINDRMDHGSVIRFQILRELIPHTDQKRDKASFLLEVIEYIRFLQEKVQKYESSYLGWNQDNANLMPWVKVYFRSFWKNARNNNQSTGDGVSDPSQVIRNGSASPGYMFSGNDNSIPVAPAMLSTAQTLTESDMAAGVSHRAVETPANFANADNMTTLAQPRWLRSSGQLDHAVSHEILNEQEELTINEGTISVSSAYSQALLTTLAQVLQSSGIDLSQASISVQINLGKRAINKRLAATSNAKDHEDPASTNQAMGHSTLGSNAKQSLQTRKRRKTNNS